MYHARHAVDLADFTPAQRSSASSPSEAATTGKPVTMVPERTQPRVLGAKRGASKPSLISRVTAKRLKLRGVRKIHVLSPCGQRGLGVSMSPSAAEMTPSPLVSTIAIAAL